MTVAEIRSEEKAERIEYKNACTIGKYLEGKLFQGEEYVIAKLKEQNKGFGR